MATESKLASLSSIVFILETRISRLRCFYIIEVMELMELRNKVQAMDSKILGIVNDRFGTRMEPIQRTMMELGNESYQKQSVENNRYWLVYYCLQVSLFEHPTCLRWRPEKKFIVIKELPSYLEKYFKTMWGFECDFEVQRDFKPGYLIRE